jgi:hypothetical protein
MEREDQARKAMYEDDHSRCPASFPREWCKGASRVAHRAERSRRCARLRQREFDGGAACTAEGHTIRETQNGS